MNKFLLKLLILSIYLINIKLFMIGSVAFKPIHIFGFIFFLIFIIRKQTIKNVIIFIIILIVVLFGYFNALDKVEFWKSLVILTLSLALLLFGPNIISGIRNEIKLKFFKFIFRSYIYVVLYGLIQFGTKNFFGLDLFYNNLGKFQFHPHYQNDLFGFSRATSIFYDPSVYAWVTNLIITLLIIFKDKIGINRSLFFKYLTCFFLGLISSLSSSGFVAFFLIIIVYYFIKYRKKNVYLVILSPLFLVGIWLLFPYLRLSEITSENTSGYARIVFPLLNLIEVFNTYPIFGRGIGQFGVEDPSLLYDGVIHNSIYGFFISFGISALLLFFICLKRFYSHISSDPIWLLLWLNLLLIFTTTGSFLSLELPFIYLIIFTLYSLVNHHNDNQIKN